MLRACRRVGDVAEVPGSEELDIVHGGNRDVRGVRRSSSRYRPRIYQPLRQSKRFPGEGEPGQRRKRGEPGGRSIRIADPGFLADQLRNHQLESA